MSQSRLLLSCISLLVLLCALIFVNYVAVFDYDIWWHIKAGDVMRESGMIHLDPFAFTREGEKYLANHEWLSQILFSIFWNVGHASGIIFLRTILVLSASISVLCIRKNLFGFISILALGTLGVVLPGIVDRPQLFSFALFALELLILARALIHREQGRPFSWQIGAIFIVLQILWLNLHGAACVAGLFVFTAFAIDSIHQFWKVHHWSLPAKEKRELQLIIGTGVVACLALLLSPSGIGNITYLWDLLFDNTAQFITEWAPRAWGEFIADTWWLWALAVWSLVSARRFPVFSGILLVIFGLLSRQAVRHEPLFAFAFLTVIILNLPETRVYQRAAAWISEKTWRPVLLLIPLAIALCWTVGKSADIVQSHSRRGTGLMEQGKGAFDFIEQHNITGPVFNSYELGGYFLFRGYPDRKVFVDGRNVDYGYDFLSKALEAGHKKETWDALEKQYAFAAAAVYYEPFTDEPPFPYTQFLSANSSWKLVYVDDWTAVYINTARVPNQPPSYQVLTPELLFDPEAVSKISPDKFPAFEQELVHAAQAAPRDISARLQLARLYLLGGFPDDARDQLNGAIALQPWRYEPYELLGILAVQQELWEEASDAFAKATSLAGNLAERIDHAALADIATNAGKPFRAFLEKVKAL